MKSGAVVASVPPPSLPRTSFATVHSEACGKPLSNFGERGGYRKRSREMWREGVEVSSVGPKTSRVVFFHLRENGVHTSGEKLRTPSLDSPYDVTVIIPGLSSFKNGLNLVSRLARPALQSALKERERESSFAYSEPAAAAASAPPERHYQSCPAATERERERERGKERPDGKSWSPAPSPQSPSCATDRSWLHPPLSGPVVW